MPNAMKKQREILIATVVTILVIVLYRYSPNIALGIVFYMAVYAWINAFYD